MRIFVKKGWEAKILAIFRCCRTSFSISHNKIVSFLNPEFLIFNSYLPGKFLPFFAQKIHIFKLTLFCFRSASMFESQTKDATKYEWKLAVEAQVSNFLMKNVAIQKITKNSN
jgi:hypothetical protein